MYKKIPFFLATLTPFAPLWASLQNNVQATQPYNYTLQNEIKVDNHLDEDDAEEIKELSEGVDAVGKKLANKS